MKPVPAPHIAGKTDYERFDNAVRKVLTVQRVEIAKHEPKPAQQPKPKKK